MDISRTESVARSVEFELRLLEADYSAAMKREDYAYCFRLYDLIEDCRHELHGLWELLDS